MISRALGRAVPFIVLSWAAVLQLLDANEIATSDLRRALPPAEHSLRSPQDLSLHTRRRLPWASNDPRFRQERPEVTPAPRRAETARYDPRQEFRQRIFTEFDDYGEDKGNWSDWDTSAPCSRSCGGGVTFKKRTCLNETCFGPTRVYSSCNIIECPPEETQERFLQKQCQRLNGVPHDGRYYSWTARRRHDRNPCELSCSPKDRDLELRQRQNVIDGTRCYHAGFEQCVEGQCITSGCDGLLGSKKRIDKCLVCGGENKNCNTTSYLETRHQLVSGYQPIHVIPKGATSIMIKETHPTSNYISIKDLNGTWYLNREFDIDHSKAFIAGGAKFHYTRNQQYLNGREFLRAEGPTNETLVFVLLVQEVNRGFELEYSLKQLPGAPKQRSGEFQWELGEWAPCVDPCGEIKTNRTVRCASIINRQDPSDPEECDASTKPPSEKKCPINNCQSEWYAGAWERCSNSCGNGTQTRVVFCSTREGGGLRVLPDRLCKTKGDKPVQQQECVSDESCDRWEAGEWNEPEKNCGVTKQTREVRCIREMENSTDGVVLDATDCLEDLKPVSEKEALLPPCKGAEWATGEWSSCTGCGQTVQTRQVSCILENGRLYNESYCAEKPKPETEKTCVSETVCEHKWYTSEWSPCSVTCGNGTKSRSIFCGKSSTETNGTTSTDDENCTGPKPTSKEPCYNPACEQIWLASPWDKECPENACGGIPRKRSVFCYDNKGSVVQDCSQDAKPTDKDDCSLQACPSDNINVLGGCASSENGCCPDGVTAAGAEYEGCPALDRENMTIPCAETTWGCCRDLVTPALGPFDAGCNLFALCNGTDFGCCQDGETRAKGASFSGCVIPCDMTEFGCCSDGKTAATDDKMTGCPVEATTAVPIPEETAGDLTSVEPVLEDVGSGGSGDVEIDVGSGAELIVPDCSTSEHGCCPNNITAAKDAEKRRGCPHCRISKYQCCPDGVTAALGKNFKGCVDSCTNSTFGCCPDGFFAAKGNAYEGCELLDCKKSKFGCCKKLKIPATGPENAGCSNCTESAYGCCKNNEDFALGPNNEGCCADSQFGCCPDNVTLAQGPDFAGCPCSQSKFGCCPDNMTAALGPKQFGCTCEQSQFGCCQDLITPALGENFANCTCNRTAFGCCSDGVTVAIGADLVRGCNCALSQFGCCPDGRTFATGPGQRGCHCSSMKYGCCPDQRTAAAGPNFLGCACRTTHYGCCSDGVTKKLGARNEGCEDCTKLKFGCCPDGNIAASGPDYLGCPCDSTEFGCCPDGVTPSKDANNTGCPEVLCHQTQFGCCPDKTAAKGFNYEGCNLTDEQRREIEARVAPRRPDGPYQPPTKPPYYEPRRFKEACFQNEDRGPCGNWTLAYYFNSRNNTCSMFYYGGCGGNDNRFPSKEACFELCQGDGGFDPSRNRLPDDTDNTINFRRTHRYPCDLPQDRGPCKGMSARFWFNEGANRCERFEYGMCKGNENNFITHKACSERCKLLSDIEKCTLPKVASQNCTDPQTLFRFDYKTRTCEYYKGCTDDVNVFRDYNTCVRTCDRENTRDLTAATCSLPKETGPCTEFTVMWTNDNGRCVPFHYGGCEGNANRFISEQECQYFCGTSAPTPRRPDIFLNRTEPVRPPSSVHMCEQPKDAGPCTDFETRYYFDSAAKNCYAFNFGGCSGNLNNFHTLEECQRECAYRYGQVVPQQPKSTNFNSRDCHLPKDRGTCSKHMKMFYYNKADGVCREFAYSGCGGNNNRFTSHAECDRSCKNAQDRCMLPTVKGRCGGSYKMWTYDAQKDICKQFDYGGCHGNANRFDSKNECEKGCVRGLISVSGTSTDFPEKCRLKSDAGSCAHNMNKFYFDLRRGKCLPFLWSGCEGNDNRFETSNDCEKACLIPAINAKLVNANRTDPGDDYNYESSDQKEICLQASSTGHGNCLDPRPSILFYYDARSGECLQLPYQGCEGNRNKFISLEKCRQFCANVRSDLYAAPPPAPRQITPTVECPPDNCGRTNCGSLGEKREVLSNGCTRCSCNHPCEGVKCSSGEKCGLQTLPGTYKAVCRPTNKVGQCPALQCNEEMRNRNYCTDDSSCEGSKKCCNTGCNMECFEPSLGDVQEVVVKEGQNATLVCPVEMTFSVEWTRAGIEVEGDRFENRDHELIIKQVNKEDAGVYECGNPDEEVKGRIALRISERPKILKSQPVVEVPLNTTASLNCAVVGGFPKPSIVWSRMDNAPLPKRSSKYHQLPQNTLQIKNTDPADQDLYLCTASNEEGNAKFMVALLIPVQDNVVQQTQGLELAKKAREDARNP